MRYGTSYSYNTVPIHNLCFCSPGLVSNLSSSFSKWRRESKGHNQSNMSDKSAMMSMVSDQVDASLISADSDTIDGMSSAAQIMMSDVTPKVMRKRKASNEMMPFSATKK